MLHEHYQVLELFANLTWLIVYELGLRNNVVVAGFSSRRDECGADLRSRRGARNFRPHVAGIAAGPPTDQLLPPPKCKEGA